QTEEAVLQESDAQSAETMPVALDAGGTLETAKTMTVSVPETEAAQLAETVPTALDAGGISDTAQTVPVSTLDSDQALPAEAPAQPESPEKKREGTQPLDITKAAAPDAQAWFSEISSFEEK